MNRFAAAHPEDWEDRLDALEERGDRLRDERRDLGADAQQIETASRGETVCKHCLDPIPAGQSWCSDSCRRAEDGLSAEEAPDHG